MKSTSVLNGAFLMCALAAGALAIGVLAPCADAASFQPTPYDAILSAELEDAAPAVARIHDDEREKTLRLTASALARMGKLDAALQTTNLAGHDAWRADERDEVWRITARRLAWQNNSPAALRCASRISGEYSRADALLSITYAHIKTNDAKTAREILQSVEPTIRQTKAPYVLSYLAYLFGRAGDENSARKMFAEAKTVEEPQAIQQFFMFYDRKDVIASYQLKLGWRNEALKIIGADLPQSRLTREAFIARRDFQPLLDSAAKLPAQEAVNDLVALCVEQINNGDKKAAQSTLALIKTRFSDFTQEQQKKSELQFILAALETQVGDAAAGRAQMDALRKSPDISPDEKAILDSSFIQTPADEQAIIHASYTAQPSFNHVYNVIQVARRQFKLGDTAAMRQTLQVARDELRAYLIAPQEKLGFDSQFRRRAVAEDLFTIERLGREAGDESSTQSTLAQVVTLLKNQAPLETTSLLLRNGFDEEVETRMEKLVTSPDKNVLQKFKREPARGWNSLTLFAVQHAKKTGVNDALIWILKISDASLRAQCLAAIVFSQTPAPDEERDFILRGSRKSGPSFIGDYNRFNE